MRAPTLTLLLISLTSSYVAAWCNAGWQDQNGNCHPGPPPGPPIGIQPANGGPIIWNNNRNPNTNAQPGGSGGAFGNNFNNQNQLAGSGNVWVQNGYTKFNHPGLFFNNLPNQGLNPFRNMRNLPFLPVNWEMAANVRIVHGVMAAIAFVGLFPLGAISAAVIPGIIGTGLHVGLQMLGFLLYLVAAGMGLWMASNIRWEQFDLYQNYHPILGILIFIILFFQPVSGALHYIGFRKHSRRGFASHVHIWMGRTFIILGIINGGLGLYISGNANGGQIMAYGLLSGMVVLVWMMASVFGEIRKHRRDVPKKGKKAPGTRAGAGATPPMRTRSRDI